MSEPAQDLGWHVMSGELLLTALRKVALGENPDIVFAELYANADKDTGGDFTHTTEFETYEEMQAWLDRQVRINDAEHILRMAATTPIVHAETWAKRIRDDARGYFRED